MNEETSWDFKLYVIDNQPRCEIAKKNLKRVCEQYLNKECHIEIIDLLIHPELAKLEQIVAIPTLQKLYPKPQKLLVGDFSIVANVLKGLGLEENKGSSLKGS